MTRCILAGVDGSEQATRAFRFALALAQSTGAELHVCAAVYGADIEMAEPQERANLVKRVRGRLQGALRDMQEIAEVDGVEITPHLVEGHPVEEMLALAARIHADHLVVGHRSKGLFERLLMGSVAKRVVDFAYCSVTVVR